MADINNLLLLILLLLFVFFLSSIATPYTSATCLLAEQEKLDHEYQ
jgi:hypothetical protein